MTLIPIAISCVSWSKSGPIKYSLTVCKESMMQSDRICVCNLLCKSVNVLKQGLLPDLRDLSTLCTLNPK